MSMKRRAGPSRQTQFTSVHALIGNDVYNHQTDELGAIQDIVMDMHTGQIGFAVLRCQADATMEAKLVAVPWSLLTLDSRLHCFVLDLSIDRLRAAPALDVRHGPALCLTTHRRRFPWRLS
jgi:sporulation protein YlmC with PRC-barrel domain